MILPIAKQTEFNKLFDRRIASCLKTVAASYGNILDIPVKKSILFNYEYINKNWFAVAHMDPNAKLIKNIVSFNPLHIEDNIDEFVDNIIPHELSHIICFNNGLDDDHGENWETLCVEMGGSGNQFVSGV